MAITHRLPPTGSARQIAGVRLLNYGFIIVPMMVVPMLGRHAVRMGGRQRPEKIEGRENRSKCDQEDATLDHFIVP